MWMSKEPIRHSRENDNPNAKDLKLHYDCLPIPIGTSWQ